MGRGADKLTYDSCVVLEEFPLDGDEYFETSTTTTTDYKANHKVVDTSTGKLYLCITDSTSGDLLTDGTYFTDQGNLYYVETSATTTRNYQRNDYIFRTDNVRKYRNAAGGADQYQSQAGDLLTDTRLFEQNDTDVDRGFFVNTKMVGEFDFIDETDVRLDTLILPNRAGDTRVNFLLNFAEGVDNSLMIEGVTSSDSTALDLEEWFQAGDAVTDTPNFQILVEGTDAVIDYGADEAGTREWRYRLKSRRFDSNVGTTAPITMKGAFLVDPLEGSLVTAVRRPGEIKRVRATNQGEVLSAASTGDTTIQFGNIVGFGTPEKGDWISLNNDASGTVYYHEVTDVSGTDPYTLTLSPDLNADITTSTNTYMIKTEFLTPIYQNLRATLDTGTATYSNTSSWSNDLTFFSLEDNSIPYATFSSGTDFTLPAGKYSFSVDVDLETPTTLSGGSNDLACALRLNSDISGWTTIRGTSSKGSSNDSDDGFRLHSRPTINGSFETTEKGVFTVNLYPTLEVRSVGSSDLRGANITFTKVG